MAPEEPTLLGWHREGNSVLVTLSGGETLEMAATAVPADLPAAGQPLSADLLTKLRDGDERKRIARELFRILDRRLYPTAILQQKLAAAGFRPDLIMAVLDQFAAEGLHSELRFAEAYCREALRRRPVGRLYLLAQLQKQGVAAEAAETAVRTVLPADEEQEQALCASRSRWARSGSRVGAKEEAKVIRFLIGRGFSATLACRAAREGARSGEDAP